MQKNLKIGVAGVCVMAAAIIPAILDEHKVIHLSVAGAMMTIGVLFVGFIIAFIGFRKWADCPACKKKYRP